MTTSQPPPPHFDNITIFETEDGKTRVEVRFEHDNVWLTQKLMAELYECSSDNVSRHLKNIFADEELDELAVTEDSSVTAADGKKYRTKLYSLEAIIAIGYRVQSLRATQFRTWATNRLKDYILKGFAIDSTSEVLARQIIQQYSFLRATIERVVQDFVLNATVQRFRDYIEVKNLKRVVGLKVIEVDEIDRLYQRCHDLIEAHDPSSAKDEPPPTPDELKQDIADLRSLIQRMSDRRNGAN